MNIYSIMALVALLGLIPYALYIDAMRRGRDSKGKFTKKAKKKTVKLFYSSLRGGVVV